MYTAVAATCTHWPQYPQCQLLATPLHDLILKPWSQDRASKISGRCDLAVQRDRSDRRKEVDDGAAASLLQSAPHFERHVVVNRADDRRDLGLHVRRALRAVRIEELTRQQQHCGWRPILQLALPCAALPHHLLHLIQTSFLLFALVRHPCSSSAHWRRGRRPRGRLAAGASLPRVRHGTLEALRQHRLEGCLHTVAVVRERRSHDRGALRHCVLVHKPGGEVEISAEVVAKLSVARLTALQRLQADGDRERLLLKHIAHATVEHCVRPHKHEVAGAVAGVLAAARQLGQVLSLQRRRLPLVQPLGVIRIRERWRRHAQLDHRHAPCPFRNMPRLVDRPVASVQQQHQLGVRVGQQRGLERRALPVRMAGVGKRADDGEDRLAGVDVRKVGHVGKVGRLRPRDVPQLHQLLRRPWLVAGPPLVLLRVAKDVVLLAARRCGVAGGEAVYILVAPKNARPQTLHDIAAAVAQPAGKGVLVRHQPLVERHVLRLRERPHAGARHDEHALGLRDVAQRVVDPLAGVAFGLAGVPLVPEAQLTST
mmetsp:Transcript_486/g.1311  ORF Transcript_486/g.1311 Transcript_486/m.1311 type:complete len:540 (+) Transcript_486:415-2034(+)